MRFDEIQSTCVVIHGVKHIPYPKACPEVRDIDACDFRVRECNHERCEIGFNGYFASGDEETCLYADKPCSCPVFTVSCLDCRYLGTCDQEMFFVALTLDICKIGIEQATHPLYR